MGKHAKEQGCHFEPQCVGLCVGGEKSPGGRGLRLGDFPKGMPLALVAIPMKNRESFPRNDKSTGKFFKCCASVVEGFILSCCPKDSFGEKNLKGWAFAFVGFFTNFIGYKNHKSMKAKTTILIALIFVFSATSIAQSLNVESPSSDTLQIPFIERFTEGSLETNNWETDCENWSIESDSGNPAPSVRFNGQPGIIGEYNCTLTSDWISTKNAENRIYIRFDNRSIFSFTGNDTLFVEVFDSVNWYTVHRYTHPDEYWEPWSNRRLRLTSFITANHFKIRFRAKGMNSLNINYWAVDNIFIYNGVWFPDQLEGYYVWSNNFGVKLKWDLVTPPDSDGGNPLTYLNFMACDSFGISDGGNWTNAIKFDTIMNYYDSSYIYLIRSYIANTDFDSIVLNIWRGKDGNILQFRQNVTAKTFANFENFYEINPPILYADTSPFWVGFEVFGQEGGSDVFWTSCNDAVDGYGNLYKTEQSETWETMSNDYGNWTTKIHFSYTNPDFHIKDGFVIYRKEENSDSVFKTYDYYKIFNGGWGFTYFDEYPNIDLNKTYSYQVRSASVNHWVIPKDTILSLPAYAKINGDEDFVTVLVTHFQENNKKDFSLTAYPNPTTTKLIIKSESKLKKVHIYNLLGQKVGELGANKQTQVEIDVSRYQKGIYLLKVETEKGVVSRKFVVE